MLGINDWVLYHNLKTAQPAVWAYTRRKIREYAEENWGSWQEFVKFLR